MLLSNTGKVSAIDQRCSTGYKLFLTYLKGLAWYRNIITPKSSAYYQPWLQYEHKQKLIQSSTYCLLFVLRANVEEVDNHIISILLTMVANVIISKKIITCSTYSLFLFASQDE